jgi:DNA sulfur modification protein DndD
MPTTIRILGWKSEGLRCPDHEVSFERSAQDTFPIVLLQMPNGTGKTTTLELLRVVFSGSADTERWDKGRIASFKKRDSAADKGLFQVNLLYNSRRLTLKLEFNFEDGTAQYFTTQTATGIQKGFNPPREIKKFLNESFVKFFVFDGELAEQLLDPSYTNAQTIIEDLFQVNLISRILNEIRSHWSKVTESKTATEERGLIRRRNRVAELTKRLDILKQEKNNLQKEYDKITRDLKKKEDKFKVELSQQREIRERLVKAEGEFKEAGARVKTSAQTVLDEMRNPHSLSSVFAEEMVTLKTSLDKAKLPESTAREFFEELAEEAECVCGRELDDETRRLIKERAAKYLGSDDVALLNALKGDISNLIGDSPTEHEAALEAKISELSKLCRLEMESKTARELIVAEGVHNNPQLESVQSEIESLKSKQNSLKQELSKYESLDDSANDASTFGIAIIERRKKDAEKKLAEVTETLELKQKRDVLDQILKTAQDKALKGISKEICVDANKRISKLMPDNAIRIEKIDRCLKLQGQEGGSVGETLSVAYAFLATLFNRAEHQLPFIVDSPANPIDLKVRSKVAELVPKLTNQFIAFTISSERQSFISSLEKAARGDILYLTLFRKGPADLERKAAAAKSTQSVDGICVAGADFFNEFHLEAEANNNAV